MYGVRVWRDRMNLLIVIPFEVFFEKILPKEKEINVKAFKYI